MKLERSPLNAGLGPDATHVRFGPEVDPVG